MSIAKVLGLQNSRQLGDIAGYLTTPIATYTHTTNKEVVVSAVDVNTNRFTSVAHTLVNGDTVFPIMNYNAGNIYPINVYPGGITYATYPGYFVKKIDADTFELYAEYGLTTIIDITTNASLDLTKWHFETESADVAISNLPSSNRYAVRIKGRSIRKDSSFYIVPNDTPIAQEWIKNGSTTYGYPLLLCAGDVATDIVVVIDYRKYLTISARGIYIRSASASTLTPTILDAALKSPKYHDSVITFISIQNTAIANGTIVEVYKA